MKASYRLPKARKGNRVSDMRPVAHGLGHVLEQFGGKEKTRLIRLWQNWGMVMGADLSGIALPMGHRGTTLLVGGEDNLALQDLTYFVPEILERVNAFMDEPFFERVELHLPMGRTMLDSPPAIQPATRQHPAPQKPPCLKGEAFSQNTTFSQMDPNAPVARCYAAYLRMHGLA